VLARDHCEQLIAEVGREVITHRAAVADQGRCLHVRGVHFQPSLGELGEANRLALLVDARSNLTKHLIPLGNGIRSVLPVSMPWGTETKVRKDAGRIDAGGIVTTEDAVGPPCLCAPGRD